MTGKSALRLFRYALLAAPVAPVAIVAAPTAAQAQVREFNVPAQPLSSAILEFSRQSDVMVLLASELAEGRRTRGVRGSLPVNEAIARLLQGTGLRATTNASGGYRILGSAIPGSGEAEAGSVAAVNGSADDDAIVVTGTNIRGIYPASSPVQIYTREEIERTGATTTEQFIQRLPQNSATQTAYANGSNQANNNSLNREAVSSINLRGLGVGTTLTLLNGRRMGLSENGQSADVSLIPLAAIARIDVLTDGASAIYGSDAIGGVVNFILRDDFDGAETRASYGGVTRGHLLQGSFSQAIGRRWTGGHAVAAYSLHLASALERGDRDYAAPAGPGDLTPDDERHNVFLTLSQDITERLTFSGDFAFANREIRNEYTQLSTGSRLNDVFFVIHSETDQWLANTALDYRLSDSLNASLQASYAAAGVNRDSFSTRFNVLPTPPITRAAFESRHSILDVTAKLDGALLMLPGGALRFSLGAGLLDEDYSGATGTGVVVGRDLGRRTTYAFGEIFVPLIGRDQSIPLLRRLELSLAGRYTSYDDTSSPPVGQEFGDSFDPKIGLLWSPFEGLNLRGTYGTSFRAPALTQIDPTGGQINSFVTTVAGVSSRVVSTSSFPSAALQPETAETFTLGFDFQPVARPSLRVSGTYYNISYEDRIGPAPFQNNIFTSPGLYPDAIFRPTSAAQILDILGQATLSATVLAAVPGVNPADRNAVAAALFALPNLWIFDSRLRNLALSEQDGFDFSISDRFQTPVGDLALNATVTWILNYRQQASQSALPVSVVDTVGRPTDLRGRLSATLSRGGFSGTLNVNYTDGYANSTGASVNEWITADLALGYRFERPSGALNGVRLGLSAQNLFDEDPPFVALPAGFLQIGFDTVNANPLGRLVVLSITKTW